MTRCRRSRARREAFGAETLTIAVVTPDMERRDILRTWTAQELALIGQPDLAEIFLFTSVDPVTTSPQTFFFDRCWHEPGKPEPVSVLIPPTLPQPAVQPSPGAVPLVKEVWRAGG